MLSLAAFSERYNSFILPRFIFTTAHSFTLWKINALLVVHCSLISKQMFEDIYNNASWAPKMKYVKCAVKHPINFSRQSCLHSRYSLSMSHVRVLESEMWNDSGILCHSSLNKTLWKIQIAMIWMERNDFMSYQYTHIIVRFLKRWNCFHKFNYEYWHLTWILGFTMEVDMSKEGSWFAVFLTKILFMFVSIFARSQIALKTVSMVKYNTVPRIQDESWEFVVTSPRCFWCKI